MDSFEDDRHVIDIVIPFYRNAQLVDPLCRSLENVCDELAELGCSLIAINDSPDDEALRSALAKAQENLARIIPCEILENERNSGFVRSANRGLEISLERGHDVLLLNSDTLIFPGALREMAEVAYSDPMIGFVSPRSNNATICSFPAQPEFCRLEPAKSYRVFRELSRFLPKYHFVPTSVGFCLYIRHEMLDEFGLLDEAYGHGYNEENDLIMRANRCGFRAALANHGFVYHFGESSFSSSSAPKSLHEVKNAALLNERYPEYLPSVQRHFSSPVHEAERLLTGLLPDRDGRLDLVFDLSSLGPYHNGTFEAAKEFLVRAPASWKQFNIHAIASTEARRFHALDEIDGVSTLPISTERKFAIAFRFGQPFTYEHTFRMSRLAPVNVYGMLDPIAYDCLHLHKTEVENVWSSVFEHADGVIYISDVVQTLFRARFPRHSDLRELVAYLSLDYRDYRNGGQAGPGHGRHILVIGNSFAHKRVPATVDALSRAFPFDKIVSIGMAEDDRHNVMAYPSGNLTDKAMDRLMHDARFVVFPSVYEGFGIPVVRSLAYGKPVLVRRTPVAEAIQQKVGDFDNLILYASPRDLINRLQAGFPKWQDGEERYGDPNRSWDSVTDCIGAFLCEMPRSVCFSRLVKRLKNASHEYGRHFTGPVSNGITDANDTLLTSPHSAELREAHERIRELAAALKNREYQVEDIYRSWSWRVTAPLRRIGSVFVGTK
jgi:GT2 family glycosyltransferase